MNLKESKEGYMRGFGGAQGREMCIHYNFKNKISKTKGL